MDTSDNIRANKSIKNAASVTMIIAALFAVAALALSSSSSIGAGYVWTLFGIPSYVVFLITMLIIFSIFNKKRHGHGRILKTERLDIIMATLLLIPASILLTIIPSQSYWPEFYIWLWKFEAAFIIYTLIIVLKRQKNVSLAVVFIFICSAIINIMDVISFPEGLVGLGSLYYAGLIFIPAAFMSIFFILRDVMIDRTTILKGALIVIAASTLSMVYIKYSMVNNFYDCIGEAHTETALDACYENRGY